jgi:PAS domain S-box-containing protein
LGTNLKAHILAAPSQHAFENLFELSPDAILISDGEGLIRSANPRTVEMFGYAPSELFGKSIDILVSSSPEARALTAACNSGAKNRTVPCSPLVW